MATDFNSTFGGLWQEPSPHSINIDKKPGSFFAEFGGKGQDISRHAIPPVPRIGSDYSNPTPVKGANFGVTPTVSVNLDSGEPQTVFPFTIRVSGSNATVTYGTINGLVPSNITSTFSIPGPSAYYMIMSVSTTNTQVSLATLYLSASPPSVLAVNLGQPPVSFDVCLGIISSGVAYRTIGSGSLIATSYEVYRLVKAMPTPDSLPYDSYYSWRIGTA